MVCWFTHLFACGLCFTQGKVMNNNNNVNNGSYMYMNTGSSTTSTSPQNSLNPHQSTLERGAPHSPNHPSSPRSPHSQPHYPHKAYPHHTSPGPSTPVPSIQSSLPPSPPHSPGSGKGAVHGSPSKHLPETQRLSHEQVDILHVCLSWAPL